MGRKRDDSNEKAFGICNVPVYVLFTCRVQ